MRPVIERLSASGLVFLLNAGKVWSVRCMDGVLAGSEYQACARTERNGPIADVLATDMLVREKRVTGQWIYTLDTGSPAGFRPGRVGLGRTACVSWLGCLPRS
jgi:hypothetical protein